MRGSALDTIVEDSIAPNRESSRPERASSTSRWLMWSGVWSTGGRVVAVVTARCDMFSCFELWRSLVWYPLLVCCKHVSGEFFRDAHHGRLVVPASAGGMPR